MAFVGFQGGCVLKRLLRHAPTTVSSRTLDNVDARVSDSGGKAVLSAGWTWPLQAKQLQDHAKAHGLRGAHTCRGAIYSWIRPNGGPFPWNRVGGAAACARGLDQSAWTRAVSPAVSGQRWGSKRSALQRGFDRADGLSADAEISKSMLLSPTLA